MTKEFYKVLEISENATQEEIKKAYRKLAQKWHPDRNKSPEATKKMQEINKAFEILGDEEKRKRYDLGETNFTSECDYSYEEELGNINDELKRLREEQKILARKDVINMVDFEMLITGIFSSKLDSNLWSPYDKWQDKIWKIKIKDDDTKEYGIDTSELDNFKEIMINAIRKRKEEWKTGINNPYFDKTRLHAIEAIEEAMKEKDLKAEDLGEYSNYKEQINNLDRQWKVRNLKDKIVVYIKNMGSGNKSEKTEKDLSFLDEVSNNQRYPKEKGGIEKQSWESSKKSNNEVSTSEQEKFPTESEKKFIPSKKANSSSEYDNWNRESLLKKVKELEEEIRELKQEREDTPEFNEYFNKKENELRESKQKLENFLIGSEGKPKSKWKPNFGNLPTKIVVGIAVIVVGLLAVLVIVKNRKKKNKY